MSSIFRKSALERLTSPEQLDKRITIISRGGFLGLLAILFLIVAGLVWGFLGTAVTSVSGEGILTNDKEGVKVIAAPQGGVVKEIYLRPGDQVHAGDAVLRLSLDDHEINLVSYVDGKMVELRATQGEFVSAGTTVGIVTSNSDDFVVLAFLTAADGKKVTEGMEVAVVPATVNQEEYGSMPGTVLSVSEQPVSAAESAAMLQDEQLVELLTDGQPPILIVVDVEEDTSSPSGFLWHNGSGPPFLVTAGTLAAVAVRVKEQRPISLILPDVTQKLGLE